MFPSRRQEQLLVRELAGETLIYDLKAKKAHCLNRTASLIWDCCDGRTAVRAIAKKVGKVLNATLDETIIWAAIKRLQASRLLQSPVTVPTIPKGTPRRQLLRQA